MTSRRKLDEILSGGHLPGRAYDEIFERVMDAQRQQHPRQPFWKWLLVPSGALAAALGVWMVFFHSSAGQFTRKGGERNGTTAWTDITIACKSNAGPQCRAGDTLMFMVSPTVVSGYLGAYAQRADDPDGERIWYFPDATGKAPFVTGSGATTVLEEGVKVGPEHRPGKYRVTLWLAPDPIERAAPDLSLAGSQVDKTILEIEIVP